MEKNKRLSQISNIRALAIILVVLGHSIILYSTGWDLYGTKWSVPLLDTMKKVIDIIQMPLFFSLSGYLFVFSHQKRRGFLHLLKNKALRLLLPYIGIGVAFMLPIRLIIGYPSYQGIGVVDIVVKFLTSNDVGHLWFLPALFVVFLLSELILLLAEKIPLCKKYAEFVLFALAAALYLEGYRVGFGYPPLLSAYKYLIWFSLGYLLCRNRDILKKLYSLWFVKWALLVVNVALLVYQVATNSTGLMVSLAITALCVINAYGAMPEASCKIIERVDRDSFGIYLFHSPLIYITFALIPNAHPALVVLINFVIFGAVAIGLTELVRKTKIKFLIGE